MIENVDDKKKEIKYLITNFYRELKSKNPIYAKWCFGGMNWGDELNPVLINYLSGKEPILANYSLNIHNHPIYSVIGSILDWCSDKNTTIWGSGFISSKNRLKKKPKEICAVRGPLTRDLIIKSGFKCPEVYGDPSLLFPLFYKPIKTKKYKLGIIPHYIDKNISYLNKYRVNADVLIIDIFGGTYNVVDSICCCEKVASSSLHGIIAADAYGIPSTWLKFSNNVFGEGFKFYDYFSSVGRNEEKPLIISDEISINDIFDNFNKYKLDLNLEQLLNSCPFLEDSTNY